MSENNGKSFHDLSDEELARLSKENNRDALAVLYLRFKGLIYKITFEYSNKHNIAQMYGDDLIDIATDSLFKAINTFNPQEGSLFINFWWTITLRAFATFVKKMINQRILTFDPSMIDRQYTYLSDNKQTEKMMTMNSLIEDVIKKNKDNFSSDELTFLKYFFLGYTVKEMSIEMQMPQSKIYRLRTKSLDKLNKIIKSN